MQTKSRCRFSGCENPATSDGLCAGHAAQQKRDKKLSPLPKQSFSYGNQVFTDGETAFLIVSNHYGDEIARIAIDPDDLETVRQFRWSVDNSGSARTTDMGLMERIILKVDKNQKVVHLDGELLNNTKKNLSLA